MTSSLLDTVDRVVTTYWVVYMNRASVTWWNKYLKPGFQHVQLWRSERYGPKPKDVVWMRIDPGLECIDVAIAWTGETPWEFEPRASYQRFTTSAIKGRVREWFFFGPITCVEIVKVHLGVKSAFVRTPWQLWKFLAKNSNTISYLRQ